MTLFCVPVGCSTICYADDTLLMVRGPSFREAMVRAELGATVVVRSIELGLKVFGQDGGCGLYVEGVAGELKYNRRYRYRDENHHEVPGISFGHSMDL